MELRPVLCSCWCFPCRSPVFVLCCEQSDVMFIGPLIPTVKLGLQLSSFNPAVHGGFKFMSVSLTSCNSVRRMSPRMRVLQMKLILQNCRLSCVKLPDLLGGIAHRLSSDQ